MSATPGFPLSDMVYGKANIRVSRTIKGPREHTIRELTVCVQIGGKRLETTFFNGDNADVVPTDTMKNVTFVLASQHNLESIESFALHVAQHFFASYAQVDNIRINIKDHPWTRVIKKDGQAEPFTFIRGGPELRFTELTQTRGAKAKLVSGFNELELLKTCGSAFANFHRCKHTTLVPTADRLLSTSVNCRYTFSDAHSANNDFNGAYKRVKELLIDHFANFVSLSVQQLLYKVGTLSLQSLPQLADVWLQMPNIHFYDFDKLKQFGLPINDTYIAFTDPNGLIEGRVSRAQLGAKL